MVVVMVAAPADLVRAQGTAVERCPECILGVYDDVTMTRTFGSIEPGIAKDLYLGVQLQGTFDGLTGLEFSIAGIRQDLDGIAVLETVGITTEPPSVVLGSPVAPRDTTVTSVSAGGMNVAWASCVSGQSIALMRIRILSFPVQPAGKSIQVTRKFPPSNVAYNNPVVVLCDAPVFTALVLSGGRYCFNVPGPDCPPTSVDGTTWSTIKSIFR
jgi:hypothetical protein